MTQTRLLSSALALVLLAGCSNGPEVAAPEGGVSFTKDPSTKGSLVPGEEQPTADLGRTPLAIYPTDTEPGVFGSQKENLAQTFTAGTTANLVYLYLPVACVPDVLIHLEIRSGGPAGPILSSGNYDPGHAFADGTFLALTMTPSVPLTAGNVYAFVLSTFVRPGAAGNSCSVLQGPPGDSYAGGQGFYNNPGFPLNYWIPLPDGAATSNEDLPFRTLVR